MLYAADLATPLGPFLVVVNGDGAVVRTAFASVDEAEARVVEAVTIAPERCAEALAQLAAYFAGDRRTFDLPLAPSGTPFQQRVWLALQALPYGAVTSYGVLAKRLGQPGGAQAVGRANAANPLPVVVPCHRVVGADGSLTGFLGGLDKKRALLHLEGALAETPDLFADQH
ncbi:MAG: methylated-DNA--[protein]-cysteine S-methyltransferase [Bacteroidota bacterium]